MILSDTVGFISDLPTSLVAAFRATLEEVLEADLVLHVRDISHAETDRQAKDVGAVMAELGVSEEDRDAFVEVWNKTDLLDADELAAKQNIASRSDKIVAVSAVSGLGLEALCAKIEQDLKPRLTDATVRLAHSEGRRRAWLYANVEVTAEEVTETGAELSVRWSDIDAARFEKV